VKGAGREAPFAFSNPAAAGAMGDITLFAHRPQFAAKGQAVFGCKLIYSNLINIAYSQIISIRIMLEMCAI